MDRDPQRLYVRHPKLYISLEDPYKDRAVQKKGKSFVLKVKDLDPYP